MSSSAEDVVAEGTVSAAKLSYKDFLPKEEKVETENKTEVLPVPSKRRMSAAGSSKKNEPEDILERQAMEMSQEGNSDDDDDDDYDDMNGGPIEGFYFPREEYDETMSRTYSSDDESDTSMDSESQSQFTETDTTECGIFDASGLPVDHKDFDKMIMRISRKPPLFQGKMCSNTKETTSSVDYRVIKEEGMNLSKIHNSFHLVRLDKLREEIRKRVCFLSSNPGIHAPGYGMYNPSDYEGLKVSPEIKEIFQYITQYSPIAYNSAQLDVKLHPFIPEYYPSVGDIDAFIKVLHPEINKDELGIRCLDEPSAFQSDPSVLDLRLRSLAKQSSAKAAVVKRVENVSKNSKIIENWIKDISDLHRTKPSPSVHYSKPMPDIDSLIQEWPPELEELLKKINVPPPDLECDLQTYVDLVCNLLDIPVYKSRIQSLHVLCTLYATQKHFNNYGPLGRNTDGEFLPSSATYIMNEADMVDHLQIL